jgi:hypothetical protein
VFRISGHTHPGAAFALNQNVAVRPDAEYDEEFWIGKILQVQKSQLQVQWYHESSKGIFTLMSSDNVTKVQISAVLDAEIHWTKQMKLTSKCRKEIFELL